MLRPTWDESAPWVFSPLISDEQAGQQGFAKGGQGRNASHLPYAERTDLFNMLYQRTRGLVREEKDKLLGLLSRVPFTGPIGIIDLDVNAEAPSYDYEQCKALADHYVKMLAAKTESYGLGNPRWYTTNELGGYHADLIAPEGFESIHLVKAVGLIVRRMANDLGIPLLSSLPKERRTRSAVYIDDSPLNRQASGRGSIWRLPGTRKPGGAPKVLVDLSGKPYSPPDTEALKEAIALIEAQALPDKPEVGEEPIEIVSLDEPQHIPVVSESLRPEDYQLLASHPAVKSIFNEIKVEDRSRRDYRAVLQAKLAGASDHQALRIMHGMPGSKYAEDKRGPDYDRSVLSSVYRTLRWASQNYEGFTRPFVYSDTERATLLAAMDLAPDHHVATKIKAVLGCGDSHTQSSFTGYAIDDMTQIHRCERSICSWCEPRRLYLQLTEAALTWPDSLYVIDFVTDDDTPEACQKKLKWFQKRVENRNCQAVLSKARVFRSPGHVVVATTSPKALQFDAVEFTRDECLEFLKDILYLRFSRTLNYIQGGDSQGLATDPWMGRIVTVTGGRESDLPWLSKDPLRDKARPPQPDALQPPSNDVIVDLSIRPPN